MMDDWGDQEGGGVGEEKVSKWDGKGEGRGRKDNNKPDVACSLFGIPVNRFNRNGKEARKSPNGKCWETDPVSSGEQNVSDSKMGDLLWRNTTCCFPLPGASKALSLTGECRLSLREHHWLLGDWMSTGYESMISLSLSPRISEFPLFLDNSIVISKKDEELPGG